VPVVGYSLKCSNRCSVQGNIILAVTPCPNKLRMPSALLQVLPGCHLIWPWPPVIRYTYPQSGLSPPSRCLSVPFPACRATAPASYFSAKKSPLWCQAGKTCESVFPQSCRRPREYPLRHAHSHWPWHTSCARHDHRLQPWQFLRPDKIRYVRLSSDKPYERPPRKNQLFRCRSHRVDITFLPEPQIRVCILWDVRVSLRHL